MVRENVFCTVPAGDEASCNVNVCERSLAPVGTPVMAPVSLSNDSPAGSAGDTDQVYRVVPPEPPTAAAYDVFTVPSGNEVVVMANDPGPAEGEDTFDTSLQLARTSTEAAAKRSFLEPACRTIVRHARLAMSHLQVGEIIERIPNSICPYKRMKPMVTRKSPRSNSRSNLPFQYLSNLYTVFKLSVLMPSRALEFSGLNAPRSGFSLAGEETAE